MLKELNMTKPITSNIDTSNRVTISTITGDDNTTTTPIESSVKEVNDDNTNTTVISMQDSTFDNSSSPVEETDKTEETSISLQPQKKLNALTKAVLIQYRKSVRNAKKVVHVDDDLDDPGKFAIQE
eukprot:3328057-Ditylum_brightwellii.AAC.1